MTEKRPVGRPKQSNELVLAEVLNSPDKRDTFVQCMERLVASKEALQLKSDLHSDDVKSTAETYNLGKGFVSWLANTIAKQDIEEALGELTSKHEVLELFNTKE